MYVCVCVCAVCVRGFRYWRRRRRAPSRRRRGKKSITSRHIQVHTSSTSLSIYTSYIRTVLCPHGDVLEITRVSLGQLRIEAHGEHALAASSEGGRREDKARDGREGGKEQGGGALHGFESAVFVYVGACV